MMQNYRRIRRSRIYVHCRPVCLARSHETRKRAIQYPILYYSRSKSWSAANNSLPQCPVEQGQEPERDFSNHQILLLLHKRCLKRYAVWLRPKAALGVLGARRPARVPNVITPLLLRLRTCRCPNHISAPVVPTAIDDRSFQHSDRVRRMLAIAYLSAWAGPIDDIKNRDAEQVARLPAKIQPFFRSLNTRDIEFDLPNRPDNMARDAAGISPRRWGNGAL